MNYLATEWMKLAGELVGLPPVRPGRHQNLEDSAAGQRRGFAEQQVEGLVHPDHPEMQALRATMAQRQLQERAQQFAGRTAPLMGSRDLSRSIGGPTAGVDAALVAAHRAAPAVGGALRSAGQGIISGARAALPVVGGALRAVGQGAQRLLTPAPVPPPAAPPAHWTPKNGPRPANW